MKKISLIVVFAGLTISCFSQDYFEKSVKKVKSVKLIALLTKGFSSFDYSTIEDKTLIIPKYDPKSIYGKNLVLNKQYEKFGSVNEKNSYYENMWDTAIQESSFSLCDYKIKNIDFETLSNVEKRKYVYLSYHKTYGYFYAMVWFVDEKGEELPLAMVLVNDFDLGDKNDIRLMFNIITQTITIYKDQINKKMFSDMNSILEDKSIGKSGRLKAMNTEEVQNAVNEYFALQVLNYISEADEMTLLIPERYKSAGLDKELSKWKYSEYKYVPESFIEQKKENSDNNYRYLRAQSAGSTLLASTTVWLLSTNNDRILYNFLIQLSSKDEYEKVIPKLLEDLKLKSAHYDSQSTLAYRKVKFNDKDQLPSDLKTVSIGYVNITKEQYQYAKWVNKSFEKKMKKYPNQYIISDNIADIADCKYRVMLKSFMQTYKRTTYTKHVGTSKPDDKDTDYVTKELFYLYLTNTKTGECFKFQDEPDFYPETFKEFVNEALK